MTTIAYKDGILAGDTMMTRGDEKSIGVQKVFKSKHFLIGFAGGYSSIVPLLHWVDNYEMSGQDSPNNMHRTWDAVTHLGSDYHVLFVTRAGVLWTGTESSPPVCLPNKFDASGSGSEFATGAMAAGASAVEAVRIASKYDIYTGGPVIKVSF